MTSSARSDAPRWIDGRRDLDRLAKRLARCDGFALDTEQDAFHAYRPKVCLLQVHVDGADFLVDPLRLRDLSPLAPVLADPDIVKVAHAAENDVDLLRRGFGLEIRGLFDTMAAAHRLGHRRCGLASLVMEHFSVAIEKKHQRSDWRKRPLSEEQIEYAARDVRFLMGLRERLAAGLRDAGLVERAALDFRRIERTVHTPRAPRAGDYLRLAGAVQLDPASRQVLRVLHALRTRIARQEDRALFRVCADGPLVELARRAPRSESELRAIRGLPERLRKRHGEEVLEWIAVARARAARHGMSDRKHAASIGRRGAPRRSAAPEPG